MDVSVENTGSLERRLKVSVPESQINEKCRTKMAELAKEVRLKGFRPGKVPQNILEKRFGKSVRQEVIGEVIESTLQTALKDKNLLPAGMPMIEEVKDENGAPLEYIATFEIFPEITLADLSSTEIEKKKVDIKESDVASTIEKMCTNMGKWEKAERAAQLNDKLHANLERRWVEGEEELQKHDHIDLLLDPKQSLKPLVEALVGKKAGDEAEETIQYPDNWHDEAIRGKKAKFNISVEEVFEKKPLSKAELADKLGLDKEDEAGLNEKVKERMQREADKVVYEEVKEKVLEALLEKNPIEKPKALLKQEREALKNEMEQRYKQMRLEEPLTDEELDSLADKRVVLGLLVNEIIKKHDIKVNNQRVRETIGEQAANFPDPKRFISYYYTNKELLQSIERLVLLDQAVDKVMEGMKVIEKPVTFDEVMSPPDAE